MNLQEIKKTSIKSLLKNPLAELENIFKTLLNNADEMENENDTLKEKLRQLTDEINRLKGEKGRPNIRPKKEDKKIDNNDDDKKKDKGHSGRGKNKKKKEVEVHTKKIVSPDKQTLPKDAQYKGSRDVVIQDINFNLNNIV